MASKTGSRYLVKTLGDVAGFFGCALQTVKQWRTGPDPMPGAPGAFDLSEIVRWRVRRAEARNPEQSTQKQQLEEAKLAVDIQTKQLRYRRIAGELIEVDEVERLLARHISEHNAQAEQLKDRVLAALPSNLAPGETERVVNAVKKAVDDLRNQMADAAEDWTTSQGP